MAINKTVNSRTKTHAAMKNVLNYVLKPQKIIDNHVLITGPYNYAEITPDNVYRTFLEEKQLWEKDSGRMYFHHIISFHADEQITPAEALEFGQQFAEKNFRKFQTLISVHQDKDHLHIHIVANTVSFVDGKKIHISKRDLETLKEKTNSMCLGRGLSLAQKGQHFDGSNMEPETMISWKKDTYNLLINDSVKSYLVDCAAAIQETRLYCSNKEEFIAKMQEKGWEVRWEDSRKNITFVDAAGHKIRDKNLSKTFSITVTKEALEDDFRRTISNRVERQEYRHFRTQLEAVGRGTSEKTQRLRNDTSVESEKPTARKKGINL